MSPGQVLPRWGDQLATAPLAPGALAPRQGLQLLHSPSTPPTSPGRAAAPLCEGDTTESPARSGGHFRLAWLQVPGAMWTLWTLLSGVGGSEWLVSQS